MRVLLSTMGVLLGLAGSTAAQENFSDQTGKYIGKYFCKVTAAGGVAWEEARKQWEGATFRPDGSFVVSVSSTSGATAGDYTLSISNMGEDRPQRCTNDRTEPLNISTWGMVRCSAALHEYRISFDELRFIKAYLVGYVSGEDNNDNTPAITIGECTRIE